TRVRGADFRGQGTGRTVCRPVVGLAARPAARARRHSSRQWRGAGGAGREAGAGATLVSDRPFPSDDEPATGRRLAGLLGWLGVSFAAAAIGGFASANAGDFYVRLIRPDWAPPGWLFGPVWTILYLLMAVSAWLVWRERGFRGAPVALGLFLAQLAANALWTWLFFAWRLGAAG